MRNLGKTTQQNDTMPQCHPTQINAHSIDEVYQSYVWYTKKQNINLFVICVFWFICCDEHFAFTERKRSVFSLCLQIRSRRFVKRHERQKLKSKNPLSAGKPARYWPELAEKEEATAFARLWIDFLIRLILSQEIHACTPNLQEEGWLRSTKNYLEEGLND